MTKFQKMGLKAMASNLSADEVAGLKELFKDFDKDGSGTISLDELREGLKLNASEAASAELDAIMAAIDLDGSGELDKKELLRFIAFHVKIAFQSGQKPVTEFNDDDGSLEISDIMRLLETRCQSYLEQFHVLDEDQSGTFGWYVPNANKYKVKRALAIQPLLVYT